jgi:hypothetical protein
MRSIFSRRRNQRTSTRAKFTRCRAFIGYPTWRSFAHGAGDISARATLVSPPEIGELPVKLGDDAGIDGVVHPWLDRDVVVVEPRLPFVRNGKDDIAADPFGPST